MNNNDRMESMRRELAEAVSFFGSGRRRERERWVAKEFLSNLRIQFRDDELRSPEVDPPDVQFGGADFEIKEILDTGYRRHADFKAALRLTETAIDPEDLSEGLTPRYATIVEITSRVQMEAARLATYKYSPETVRSLDLLLYVNLIDVFGLVETPLPNTMDIAQFGWRSVSFLMGHDSCVLAATHSAPSFLRTSVGSIFRRDNTHLQTIV